MEQSIRDSIDRYVRDRVPTGNFLRAVLSNNLTQAFMRADDESRRDLFEIARYCYNDIPANCWGSPEKVKAWLSGDKAKYFTCKCGEETEAPADESTKCPMCGRVGWWDPA